MSIISILYTWFYMITLPEDNIHRPRTIARRLRSLFFFEAVSLKSSDLVDGVIHQPPGSLKDWKDCFPIRSPGSLQRNKDLPSLKLTNCPWNWMVGRWNFLLGWPIFRGYVSFGGGGIRFPKRNIPTGKLSRLTEKVSTFPKKKYTSLNIVYTCFFR